MTSRLRRLLITGGTGYLGSALRQTLMQTHAEWWLLANHDIGSTVSPHEHVLHGSLSEQKSSSQPFDAIIHLRGLAGDAACAENTVLAKQLNIEATADLIQFALSGGARCIVYPSTMSVYDNGTPEIGTVDEHSVISPAATYGQTKYAAEELLRAVAHRLDVRILRFPSIYGPSPRLRRDTFIHRYVDEATSTGQIRVFELGRRDVWRPVLSVQTAIQALLDGVWSAQGGSVVTNVVSENQPIRVYAERVREVGRSLGYMITLVGMERPSVASYRVRSETHVSRSTDPTAEFRTTVEALFRALSSIDSKRP